MVSHNKQLSLLHSQLPSNVTYVETHGTGTKLGDPIEVGALCNVYKRSSNESSLVLGALKTSIGHTEGAAGVAGIIKTVLCLQREAIPPNLHFKKLNSYLPDIDTIGFTVPTNLVLWRRSIERKRFAGVSLFGFSGTNAHIILEEAPDPLPTKELVSSHTYPFFPFCLSAKSATSLLQNVVIYLEYIQ